MILQELMDAQKTYTLDGCESFVSRDCPDLLAVRFQFAGNWICISIDPADDTLSDDEIDPTLLEEGSWQSCSFLNEKLIGSSVRWVWRMTNNQGYDDGIQLEFGLPDKGHFTLQLPAIASRISLRAVDELP